MGSVIPIGPRSPRQDDWRSRLIYEQTRNGNESIVHCLANAQTILRNDPRWLGVLAYNELSQAIVCRREAPWCIDDAPYNMDPARPWDDNDAARVMNWLQREWYLKVSESTAFRAASMVASASPFDPLREWISSCEWDARPRVARWLTTYFGVEDTEYSRFIGQSFLVGSVARALWRGCKMDCMLILEGPQGLNKSQGVERLYGSEWFRETPIDLRSNDRFMALRDCWCREWPELDGYGKADAARVKSFLSPRYDDYRAPYARSMVRVARGVVFVATVNPPQLGYLVDESGNRRMWPVECGKVGPINLDAIDRDRTLIWAEARLMFESGVQWWPQTPEDRALCNQQQESRMVAEVWEGKIGSWLSTMRPGSEVTVRQVLSECLGVPTERHDRSNSTRASVCLSRCGWTIGGRRSSEPRERYYVQRNAPLVQEAAE